MAIPRDVLCVSCRIGMAEFIKSQEMSLINFQSEMTLDLQVYIFVWNK